MQVWQDSSTTTRAVIVIGGLILAAVLIALIANLVGGAGGQEIALLPTPVSSATIAITAEPTATPRQTPTPAPTTAPPIAVIAGPAQGLAGHALRFSARGSTAAPGNNIDTYVWDFGDGIRETSGVEVGHAYGGAAIYELRLTVTDSRGAAGTTATQIRIDAPTPTSQAAVASIAAPFEAQVGEIVTFDGSGSSSGNEIISFEWDFGDGLTGSDITVDHAYAVAGRYNVTLTITDSADRLSIAGTQIRIQALPTATPTNEPTATVTATPSPTATATPLPVLQQLENVRWTLAGALSGTEITALFDAGTLTGSAGCNEYAAKYQAASGALVVSSPAPTTELVCGADVADQEAAYLAALAGAQSYQLGPAQLTIVSTVDGQQARLDYVTKVR